MALNNQQWLICHKTKPNQTKPHVSSLLLLDCVKPFAVLWHMLVYTKYITWPNQFEDPSLVVNIVVGDALTRCPLLHSKCNLKATQMKVHHQIVLLARISLTLALSLSFSPSVPSSICPQCSSKTASCIHIKLLEVKFVLVDQHWHVHVKLFIKNVNYGFVLASPAMSPISCYKDGFRDET